MSGLFRNALRATGRASSAALDTFQRVVSFALAATVFFGLYHRLSGSYRPEMQQVSYVTISAIIAVVTLGLYWWFIEDAERRKNAGAVFVQLLVGVGFTIGILVYWMR